MSTDQPIVERVTAVTPKLWVTTMHVLHWFHCGDLVFVAAATPWEPAEGATAAAAQKAVTDGVLLLCARCKPILKQRNYEERGILS